MKFFDRLMEIVCPCPCFSSKKSEVLLEEIVIEDPCPELREIIIES
jgi:hypothetical protein